MKIKREDLVKVLEELESQPVLRRRPLKRLAVLRLLRNDRALQAFTARAEQDLEENINTGVVTEPRDWKGLLDYVLANYEKWLKFIAAIMQLFGG